MKKIAYISMTDEEASFQIKNDKQDAVHFEKVVTDNDQVDLNDYAGVVLQDSGTEDIYYICEMIMKLKKRKSSFVWIMTDDPLKSSSLVYLKLGADGILDSNCESEHIKWQINNSIVRYQDYASAASSKTEDEKSTRQSSIQLFPQNLSIVLGGETEIELTKSEYKLIELLNTKPNQAYSYEEISMHVWGEVVEAPKSRLGNLICRLRSKLARKSTSSKIQLGLKTVRNKGYMLCLEINN